MNKPNHPFISISSDLGVESEEVAIMKAVALQINPDAIILDLRHSIPGFNIVEGAWTMETVHLLPVGYHVCVVDPGVGTERRGVIIKTKRGDYLLGPDNGVLIPAAEQFLGGIEKVVEIKNEKYMRKPVSPVFHGRDVFTPAAAWLSRGTPIEEFGPEIDHKKLVGAPYTEGDVMNKRVKAQVIHINRFGTIFINIKYDNFVKSGIKYGDKITVEVNKRKIKTKFLKTFGEVPIGEPLVIPDDFGRIEIAMNQDNFSEKYKVKLLDTVKIKKM